LAITNLKNSFNKNAKGYYKYGKNFQARIRLIGKQIYLGTFSTEEEARNAYLEAKEKYHIIE
jgi:hypothetical protein